MKKLILIPFILIALFGFSQSVSPGFGSGKVTEAQSRALTDGGDIYPNCASSQIDELKRADIYDKAVLLLYPNSAKAGTLYATSDVATGDFTSTRSSVKSTTDTDGNVSHIAINYPAIDYSLGCPFISLESGVTNLFLNSDVGATQTVTVVSGQDYAFYFRSGTGSIALTGAATQTISVSDGTFDNVYLFTAASTSLVCTVTGTANEVQCELNDYASSYIVTDGSTATRAADALTGAGDATLFSGVNSSGVLFAEFEVVDGNTNDWYISINSGTDANLIGIRGLNNNRLGALIKSGGASEWVSTTTTITGRIKVAISWADANFSIYINGSKAYEQLSGTTPTGLAKVDFNYYLGQSFPFYGKDWQLGVYTELTAAELVTLTTP